MNEEREILNVKEAAEYLGVHPVTIYRLLAKKCVPGRKLGGHWRFSKAAIKAWIEKGGE